jgi:competence protein ComEC
MKAAVPNAFVMVFAFLALAILLSGCTNPPAPEQNGTQPANATNATVPEQNNTNVTIITNQQQNQTVQQQQNITNPAPAVESKEINYTFQPNDTLAIYFIYVGDAASKLQGDAILIKKGDLDVLVDAGSAQTGGRVVDFLKSKNIDDIDVMLSTNADPDHYGGLGAVAAAYRVEEFWWSGKTFNDQSYAALGTALASGAEGNVKTVRTVGRGFNMTLNGITLSVLSPGPRPFGDMNNDAVVLRVQDRNFSAVLLSGAQLGAQGDLLSAQKGMLKCDVMQAPYYGLGAGTSGIANLLTSIKPKLMVISGGPDESAASGGSRDPFRRLLDQDGIPYIENYADGGSTVRITYDGEACAYGYLGGASEPC